MLTAVEAHELAALQAEYYSQPPIEQMSFADLKRWHREWGCGPKGDRLDELRHRARSQGEQRADAERAATSASMSPAELEEWLNAYTRENVASSGVASSGEQLTPTSGA